MTASSPLLYLLDVEGTVAPISLVSDHLFPYAREHFAGFLAGRAGDADVQADLELLARESQAETGIHAPRIPALSRPEFVETPDFQLRALGYLFWLMDHDRKSTALKSLQGKIWKVGFVSGELRGTLFPDVPAALERWARQARVAIYSSGSVEAQRLLFQYSVFGDMTPWIAGYFDTRIGPKVAKASYEAIASSMEMRTRDIVFFSDVVRELDPAREAGCQTRLVVREGNAPVEDKRGHRVVDSLMEMR